MRSTLQRACRLCQIPLSASHAIEPGLTSIDFALKVERLQESDSPLGTEPSLRGGSMSGGAGSLLDEHIDPDYQPSEKEAF